MSKAILIDTTKCIGCRACQVACKSWNDLKGGKATFSETWSNPRYLSSNQYHPDNLPGDVQPGRAAAMALHLPALHALP